MSEEFTDVGRGITLCHESFGDPADPPILLIMGLATQMIGWHEDFCEGLAERGFHVTRFDNRDIGRSTHMDFPPPTPGQMLSRRLRREQYELGDMGEDAAGLLRALDLAPAHIVGASMGGMIGQTLSAHHPELVRSLVSIMSNTGNRWRGQPSPSVYKYLLRRPPTNREAYVERAAEIFGIVGSQGLHSEEDIRTLASRSFDRGYDARGGGRQLGAIIKSGDRTKTLRRIKVPTLVIHGTKDKLVRPSGGRATAKAIPGARLMTIEGMGHDLPRPLWPKLIDAIATHCRAADGERAGAPAGVAGS
jgi:pimeloyl-ACP methyl ester carboxylesterase